jgi:hypothetical protein
MSKNVAKKENVMESSSYFADRCHQPKHLSLLFLGFVLFVIARQDHPIFLLGRLHFVLSAGAKKKNNQEASVSFSCAQEAKCQGKKNPFLAQTNNAGCF